jgi:hypothetical protein
VPVVPLVYWMIATSSVAAAGKDAEGRRLQELLPGDRSRRPLVSAARDSRAFASGRCSAKRSSQAGARDDRDDVRDRHVGRELLDGRDDLAPTIAVLAP